MAFMGDACQHALIVAMTLQRAARLLSIQVGPGRMLGAARAQQHVRQAPQFPVQGPTTTFLRHTCPTSRTEAPVLFLMLRH